MSIYRKYDIAIGDKIILNGDYSFGETVYLIKKGAIFYVSNIVNEEGYLEIESDEKYRKYITRANIIIFEKIKTNLHIASNMSTWFDLDKRCESLKILLDEK